MTKKNDYKHGLWEWQSCMNLGMIGIHSCASVLSRTSLADISLFVGAFVHGAVILFLLHPFSSIWCDWCLVLCCKLLFRRRWWAHGKYLASVEIADIGRWAT